MPTVPKKSLIFALVLILAQFYAYLYQPCELRMAQAPNPFKLTQHPHLPHPPCALQLTETHLCSFFRVLRTVIAAMRNLSQTFRLAGCGKTSYNPLMDGVFIIFTLLSALRRGTPLGRAWRIFYQLHLSIPKTSFWIALCEQANLLTHHQQPSAFFHTWLGWPRDAQILHLFAAWETAPRNHQERLLRRRLRLRLEQGQPLLASDARLLPGLEALGITNQGNLTRLGKATLGLDGFPTPIPRPPWQLTDLTLVVSSCPNWLLLWQLEAFLMPMAPFTYRIDRNRACQPGQAEKLIEILETGLRAPLPGPLRARLLGQPSLQTSTGLVLEFSDPAELRLLRRSPALRSHFERLLSPRHVLVDEKTAPRLLKLLERRGIYTGSPLPILGEGLGGEGPGEARTHLPRAALLQPLGDHQPLLGFIQQSIRQQLAFDLLYHAPNGERPEIHRITPLLIEERGGYTYVIAYSHTRRGQRTYRLDRMEVPGTVRE